MTTPMKQVPRDLPAPTNANNVLRRILLVAASQIGYREGSDNGNWNNDNIYGKAFGQNYVSWCNWFVSQIAVSAGVPSNVIPRGGYTPSTYNWFVSRDYDVETPRAGDIFYVYGNVSGESRPRVHHVGFVEKVTPSTIQTIEGNTNTSGSSQGNGVYRLIRPRSSRLRYVRPPYSLAVRVPEKPPVSKPTEDPDMTPAQMTELKNHMSNEISELDKKMRRNFARILRYGLQTQDEIQKAVDKHDETLAAGGTEAQALDAMWQVLAPLDAALAQEQAAI